MRKTEFNILLVGVGGQGVILASRIISLVFFEAGYDVKQSEVHGMSQRGGAVSSHIRAGEKVYSPLIPTNDLDFLISFERMEAYRYIEYISNRTEVIFSDSQNNSERLALMGISNPKSAIEIPASLIASKIGDIKVSNAILIGYLSSRLPIDKTLWIDVITKEVKKNFVEQNIEAFNKGYTFNSSLTKIF